MKQRERRTATFSGTVRKAEAAIKGFHIGFTDSDRWLYRQEIDIDPQPPSGNRVDVDVDFLLRDSSGYIDDRFDGWVQVLVIADVA